MRQRGWGRKWAWLALMPVLVGCADLQAALTPPDDTKTVQAPAPEPPAAAPEDDKMAALPPKPHPPKRPAPPRLPPLEPEALKGLDQEQALALFGRPGAISEAAPATVWHYSGHGCQLDLFFYMDLETHSFHVLSYEFGVKDRSAAVQRSCLNRLREASRAH